MLNQKYFADVDFVVYNGDMLNDFMQIDQVFNGFLDVTVKRYAKEHAIPVCARQPRGEGKVARALPDFFPTVDGRAYYSFDHGGVHFVVLDSGEDKEDSHQYYNGLVDYQNYRREQAEWLKADLESDACRKAAFRIVFSHIPPRGARGVRHSGCTPEFRGACQQGGSRSLAFRPHAPVPARGGNAGSKHLSADDRGDRYDYARGSLPGTAQAHGRPNERAGATAAGAV